jgi:hypothetical protein
MHRCKSYETAHQTHSGTYSSGKKAVSPGVPP